MREQEFEPRLAAESKDTGTDFGSAWHSNGDLSDHLPVIADLQLGLA
jgi:hypothetical protein